MVKFAIIISGQARILNRSFLNYLDKLNISYDVYIHYWIPKNNSYDNCGNLFNTHNIKNISNNLHEQIINTYNPKKIECEEQIIFNLNKEYINYSTNSMQNTISQFYGINKGFNLIDNLEEYTYFIRIRFDFQFMNCSENLLNIDDNYIYFLKDIVWFVPNKLSNIFNIYNYIYNTDKILNNMPENIIDLFLCEYNIQIKINLIDGIIDRTYIKKGILYFNQGFTDIFNCLSLINYYTEKYNYIFLFMRDDMKDFIDYYTKNIDNIKIIYIPLNLHLEYFNSIVYNNIDISINNSELQYLNIQSNINDLDKIYIGQMDKFNNNYPNIWNNKIDCYSDFIKLFYESQNLDYKIKNNYFNFNRDYELENVKYNEFINKYGDNYILYHSDEKTILLEEHIKYKYENMERDCCGLMRWNPINIDNISIIFYDYIKVLQNSKEIHIYDGSWSIFIYLLDFKYKLFENIKIYYYPLKHNIIFFINNPLLENWKIINFDPIK